jgi:NAD(P)-dependent dehydrogenase (short-subunit alcohol dehydrogenase family)
MGGRVSLVTGASDGVGQFGRRRLAESGAVTLIAARDQAKGGRVRDEIRKATGNDTVDVVELDLANLASVRGRRQQCWNAGTGSTFSSVSPDTWGMALEPRRPTASR